MTSALSFESGEVYVGRDIGGRRCTIDAADVERYMRGTDDRHPWYTGPSPFGGSIAPALLYHSEVYRELTWYLPNLIGNLHAKQEWELFEPMHVGTEVRTRSTVVERYRKRNRDYVVNEVLITDPDGRWLQRSRTHQSFLAEQPNDELVVDKSREQRADRRFDIAAGGERLAALSKTASIEMCEAFSGPLPSYHTNREMARQLGFPDIVVQGMMSVCFISELMTSAFGSGWFRGGKLAVNLVNVLWGEETVTACGQIREAVGEGARTRVHCDVWAEKADGTKTVVGTASALR